MKKKKILNQLISINFYNNLSIYLNRNVFYVFEML